MLCREYGGAPFLGAIGRLFWESPIYEGVYLENYFEKLAYMIPDSYVDPAKTCRRVQDFGPLFYTRRGELGLGKSQVGTLCRP